MKGAKKTIPRPIGVGVEQKSKGNFVHKWKRNPWDVYPPHGGREAVLYRRKEESAVTRLKGQGELVPLLKKSSRQ